MNKPELILKMSEKCNLSKKDAEAALLAFIDTVGEALAENDRVALVGFGTFSVGERAAREGRNPKTGEPMTIGAAKAPKFKAGSALKAQVK